MKKTLLVLSLAAASAGLAPAEVLTALTDANYLLFFDHASPGTVSRSVQVTGLGGASLVGLDYRPATGGLYALGNNSRLYLINPTTGVATAVGSAGAFTLSGTRFGFNFNPTVDRIRVVSDADQNLRLNPNDGALAATDGNLAFATGDVSFGANPNVTAVAYTNSFAGAASTVLYGIDSTLNRLVSQNPPNAGTLNSLGTLGVDPSEAIGFDISGVTGRAYAVFNVGGTVGLYTVDTLTGTAASLGPIGPAPEPVATGSVIALAAPSGTRWVNLSSRGRVGTGADVLIGGFVARGGATTKVLVRAVGPSLGAFGVSDPLADPMLEVYDATGTRIGTNDNWQDSQAADITATGFAPSNANEAAFLVTVPAGAYTVVVKGKNGATGVAVVEAYEVP